MPKSNQAAPASPGLAPAYDHAAPNENLVLYEGKVVLRPHVRGKGTRHFAKPLELDARIYVRWMPQPALEFLAYEAWSLAFLIHEGRISIPGRPWTGTYMFRQSINGAIRCVVTDALEGFAEPRLRRVEQIVFHLANADLPFGDPIREGTGVRRARQVFNVDGWRVVIDALPDHDDRSKRLREEGGYFLTGVGAITREDEKPFSPSDAEEILQGLEWFLPFVWGRWSTPLLLVGCSRGGTHRWYRWRVRRLSSWRQRTSWVSAFSIHKLGPLFASFVSKRRSVVWRDTLKLAVHWWVEALNAAGAVEGSIVLAQSGFEILWWAHDLEMVGPRRKAEPSISKKIRGMLARFRISDTIPERLKELRSFVRVEEATFKKEQPNADPKKNEPWDGPRAITLVRNRLVHKPEKTKRLGDATKLHGQAWELSLSYLEQLILASMDHVGIHRRRFRPDQNELTEEQVPWA